MKLNLSLDGKHALVCGASSGIGREAALGLAAHGAMLTLTARRLLQLEELAAQLQAKGAAAVQIVVADLDTGESAIETILKQAAGLGPIEILINNSGGPSAGPILNASAFEFNLGFNRHIVASQLLVQGCLDGMVLAGYGRIINIISTSVREPIPSLGVSNTIRGAMAAWSKTLARELPPGITINNVLPGFTDTERLDVLRLGKAKKMGKSPEDINREWLSEVPEGRLAKAQEVAAAIVFLASPAASFIRGVNLPVDGGRMRSI